MKTTLFLEIGAVAPARRLAEILLYARRSVLFQLQTQVRTEQAMYLPDSHRTLSGFRDDPRGTEIRINSVRPNALNLLITHCFPPSRLSTGSCVRPNPRHRGRKVNVAFADGHVESPPMQEPFYPGPHDQWFGNNITDPSHPDYKDQLWDLE